MNQTEGTAYDPEVIKELLELFTQDEISADPILQAVDGDLEPVRENYSLPEVKSSYRKHSKIFFPDLAKDKDIQKKHASFFGIIAEAYHNLIDLQSPESLATPDNTIPYSIGLGYNPIEQGLAIIAEQIKGIDLETSNHQYALAKIVDFVKDTRESYRNYAYESFLRADIVKNPEEIEKFIRLKAEDKLHEDLEHSEGVLSYGYRYCSSTPEDGISAPYDVSIKHLEQRGVFDALPGEWITVDRDLVFRTGYPLKRKSTVYEQLFGHLQTLTALQPSTMTMRTKDGWLFVAKSPYHRRLLPKEHFLIPIGGYVDSQGTAIVDPEYFILPEKVEDRDFEDDSDPTEYVMPWICLSPDAIETLRNYVKGLDGTETLKLHK